MLTALLSLTGLGGIGAALFFVPGLRTMLGALLKGVPWQLWAALGLAAALWLGVSWHKREITQLTDHARAAGKAAADAQWQSAFDRMRAASQQWKTNYETASATLAQARRTTHDQDLRDITAAAGDLRLRGPGAAGAPACGRPLAAAGAAAAAAGPDAPAGPSDAPVAPVPAGEGLAILPWADLVSYAEQHDALRSEALTWRSWYTGEVELQQAAKAKLPEVEFAPAAANSPP